MQTEADIYNGLFREAGPKAGQQWPGAERIGDAGPLYRLRFSDGSETLTDPAGAAYPAPTVVRQELGSALTGPIMDWLVSHPLRLWPTEWQTALREHTAQHPWLSDLLTEVLPADPTA